MNKIVRCKIYGTIMQTNLFHREQPASLEGSPDHWDLVVEVIDHGCSILVEASRTGYAMRDSVTAALLRRALITGEGIRVLLTHGLEEDAFVLFRTLLDIEVNLRLVTHDETDEMARRLAAFHYFKGQKHITKIFSHPDTRNDLHESSQDLKFTREAGRRMKKYFDMPAFNVIRDAVKENQYWHGRKNVEDAYEAVDCISDYIYLYDSFSPFTHASNLNIDFTDIVDGRPILKALPQRDPVRNFNLLKNLLLKLVQIFELFLQDKGNPKYQDYLEVRSLEDGECYSISPLLALQKKIIFVFDDIETDDSAE